MDDENEDHECVAKRQRGPYKWGWACATCTRPMYGPEPDGDLMREALDARNGIER